MANKQIMLRNVVISFPAVFTKPLYQGVEQKYSVTFMIPKTDIETKAKIDAIIKEMLAENKAKIASDKICIKDGDQSGRTEYAGHWTLKASSAKRITIINRDKSPITENDGLIYGGCVCNAVIDFWYQNNSFSKRINSNLLGLQYVSSGTPFGSDNINVSDSFEMIEDDSIPKDDDLAF